MAQDNNGLRISAYDSGSAVYNSTTEFVEFGLEYGESMDLLPGAENGIAKSVKSSLSSTLTQTVSICADVCNGLKWFLGTFKVFWMIVIYSIVGALIFMKIETPNDLESRREQRDFHLMARDVLSFNIRQIHESRRLDADYEIKQAIIQFEENIGVSIPDENSIWTFWMSILYVGTIYTTIGYGNIACSTTLGRGITVIYALIGIPMMLVVLNQTGEYLLKIVKESASIVEDLALFVGVKTRIMRIKSERSLARYIKISKTMTFLGLSSTSMPPKSMVIVPEDEKLKHSESEKNSDFTVDMSKTENMDQEDRDPPVLAALIVTIAWMLAASAVFCLWEDWSYSTSMYFFFISTSTIGFGDVSPAHPEYMMAAFSVVIIGLSLVSVCINLVQEWLSNWYMNFLQNMLQQYIDNQMNGDENAAKQFMTGFNSGQMKYFMPLISKRTGKEAMDQLKKEAKDKGFELPPALTDLDPKTGKPAFLNASEKQIDEIIEKAQNEGKLSPTMMPTTTAISIQASIYGDREIGQTQTELSWEFFEAKMQRGTQFEPELAGKVGVDAEIEARPRMTTTAIQPEVSSIFQFWKETVKDNEEMEQKLENVVLAKREASLEDDQIPEEVEEIGILRFLKSTGTQVQPEVVDSANQMCTDKNDFGQQKSPEIAIFSGQTSGTPIRTTKTQTMLTTCILTTEELEAERERMKNELKTELLKEKAERIRKSPNLKKILLSSAEKSALATKLVKIRQEKIRKLREEGKEIRFDISQEKEILTQDLKNMRAENAKLTQPKLSIESDFDRNQRLTVLSVSDDDVFLADSEADSSTSTLPGPQQFAVPSKLDFNRRMEQKRMKEQLIEQRKQSIFEAGEGEEESDEEISKMGLKLIDSLYETPSDELPRPKSAIVSSVLEESIEPTAKVELTQSQPVLTVFGEGYEEVTLNVHLIRESISSFNSSAQSQSVTESISQFPGAFSPAIRVHPELLSSGDMLASPTHDDESISTTELAAEDLPIDELESLIDFDDLFYDEDLKKSVDEEIELFFMSATRIQTELSYFDRRTSGMVTDPEKFANSAQTDLTTLDDERGRRSILEALIPKQATIWAQTAPMVTTEAIQTDVEKEDKCVGEKVDYESIEIQTTEKETKEASSETAVTQNRIVIQTEQITKTEDNCTQVETSQKNKMTETDSFLSFTAIQSEISTTFDTVQTEEKSYSSTAAHVVVETVDSSTETIKSPELLDSATETDKLPKMSESSTETDEAPKTTDSSVETEKLPEMTESSVETDKIEITNISVDASEIPKMHEMFTETDGLVKTVETAIETESLPKMIESFTDTDDLPRISETSVLTDHTTEICNISTATEPLPTMAESSTNTEPQIELPTMESATETEKPLEKIDSLIQTDETVVSTAVDAQKVETHDNISQTETTMVSTAISSELHVQEQTAIQPEISTLYKSTTRSNSDHELTYMVDNSTEHDYDLIMQHATTQSRIKVDNFEQQFNAEFSDVSMQVGVQTKDENSQTIHRARTPSPLHASMSYTHTWMQTTLDEPSNPPVLLEANISVASSLSSSAIQEGDSEHEGESIEPPEGDLSVEATFPVSFFVQSITLTSSVETQVDLIHADVETQTSFGDFTHDAEMQVEIEMFDRQTSLNSNDLEPEDAGISYKLPTSADFFPWSDFDVVLATEEIHDSEEPSNQPSTAEESVKSVQEEVKEQQPGPSQPKEEETLFVRKKVVRKVRRKKKESVDSKESVQVQVGQGTAPTQTTSAQEYNKKSPLILTRVWSNSKNSRK